MSPTNFSPPWLSDLSCQWWYWSDWLLEWYSKLKSQPPTPELQVNVCAGPKTASRKPASVEHCVPPAHPLGLKVELDTVPDRKPWNSPTMPGLTVDPWWDEVSQAPGLSGPVVVKVPSRKSSVTLKVPSPLSCTLNERSKVSFAQGAPQVPPSGELLGNGPKS